MFILLLESSDNIINSVQSELYKKYPKSCRGFINESVRYDSLSKYKMKPLLSNGWLIHCNINLSLSYLNYLNKLPEINLYLFSVESKRAFNKLKDKFDSADIAYKAIDNLEIPKGKVIEYIVKELQISLEDAKYLYKRHSGYLRDIMTSVHVLKALPLITRSDIKKYTVPTSKVRIFDIVTYIVNPNSSVSYDSIIKLLYQYQYGLDYLFKYLLEQLEIYLCVFGYVIDGVVNITNYKIIKSQLPDTNIKSISEYQLLKIIESFDFISYDKLYLTYQFIADLSPNKEGLVKLIDYLKINKEVKHV